MRKRELTRSEESTLLVVTFISIILWCTFFGFMIAYFLEV